MGMKIYIEREIHLISILQIKWQEKITYSYIDITPKYFWLKKSFETNFIIKKIELNSFSIHYHIKMTFYLF